MPYFELVCPNLRISEEIMLALVLVLSCVETAAEVAGGDHDLTLSFSFPRALLLSLSSFHSRYLFSHPLPLCRPVTLRTSLSFSLALSCPLPGTFFALFSLPRPAAAHVSVVVPTPWNHGLHGTFLQRRFQPAEGKGSPPPLPPHPHLVVVVAAGGGRCWSSLLAVVVELVAVVGGGRCRWWPLLWGVVVVFGGGRCNMIDPASIQGVVIDLHLQRGIHL